MTKKLKILIFIAVILALILVYTLYFSKPDENIGKGVVPVEKTEVSKSGEQISQAEETLKILSLLNNITLNLELFEDPLFKSLSDFSVELPPPQLGKSNPFAP